MTTPEPLALATAALGLPLLALGTHRIVAEFPSAVAAHREGRGLIARLVPMARGLRLVLVGVSLIGLGAGLALERSWLVTLSLVVGLEELYETTAVLGILRWAERRGWPETPAPRAAPMPRFDPRVWSFGAGSPAGAVARS